MGMLYIYTRETVLYNEDIKKVVEVAPSIDYPKLWLMSYVKLALN